MNCEVGRELEDIRPTVGALGRIMLHNRHRSAILQTALEMDTQKQTAPNPNAEPPRVTVQDLLDYHLLKDHCPQCQKPWTHCRIHS